MASAQSVDFPGKHIQTTLLCCHNEKGVQARVVKAVWNVGVASLNGVASVKLINENTVTCSSGAIDKRCNTLNQRVSSL
jgi:hypothetical protein